MVLAWSSCQSGSTVRVGGVSHHSSRTGTTIVVVLPDHITGIGCCGACTRCDTVLNRAAQCGPTSTATILDDTHSRSCGLFGRPFLITFLPVSCRASLGSVSPLGLVVNISHPTRNVGFSEHMVGDPMRTVASGPHRGSVAEVPSPSLFVNMQVETPVASP